MRCPTQVKVSPNTLVRRARRLSLPGKVMVQVGDPVEPETVIARGPCRTVVRVVDVAAALNVTDHEVTQCLEKQVGQPVAVGEVIASKKGRSGLFGRSCRSPVNGSLMALVRGRAMLHVGLEEEIELMAHLRGAVVEIIPDYGAVVESWAALIEGVWGCGGESFGVLKMLVTTPDEPLSATAIDVSSQGCIIVGGSLTDSVALMRAAEVKVQGIVIGGIHAGLIGVRGEFPFPIVATDGLGALPMSEPIFDLLRARAGEQAALSGRMEHGGMRVRPEVVIPSAAPGEPARRSDGAALREGDMVRIGREPYLGRLGFVQAVPPGVRALSSGVASPGAEIRLEGGEVVFVPLANLECIRDV